MHDREAATSSTTETHTQAAEAFVDRALSRLEDDIVKLYVFGSTVRGTTRGLASDVDVMPVLSDDADRETTADVLHELAYDVMLEYGPVVELHIRSDREFERARKRGNPFITRVVREGRSYA